MSDQANPAVGYSSTPLPRKLGIKPEQSVLLVDAPVGFDLGGLPPGASLTRTTTPDGVPRCGADVTVVFCADHAGLRRWFGPLKASLGPSGCLWIAWPKKAAKVPTDLDEAQVREHGLAAGLVDVKICAVDLTWSGLKFVYRLADRPSVSRTQA